jgi:hypothetical protein
METTKITKEKLNLFVICGKHYLNNTPKNNLWGAIDTILPHMVALLKKVEKKKEFIRLSLCKKTATKHVELDKNGRYQYTEDDNKKLIERLEEVDNELVDVPVIIAEEYPAEGMTYDMRKAFEGIVIPGSQEIVVMEIEEELEEQD